MSVNGRRWVGLVNSSKVSLSKALFLGVFLGSVALSGCIAESTPDAIEHEGVDDVDLALEEGVDPEDDELAESDLYLDLDVDLSQPIENEPGDDGPPGKDEPQDPDPHPWFTPADPVIDDSDPEATPT